MDEDPQRLNVQSRTMQLDPQWVAGFVDGEGCFHVSINKHPEMTVGYQVLPEFTVVQHESDVQILHKLKAFFGCGVVRRNHEDRQAYRVRSVDHLKNRIVPFFEKVTLKTKKRIDFMKFRIIVNMMSDSRHLNAQGIQEIRSIAEQMNRKGKIKSGSIRNNTR